MWKCPVCGAEAPTVTICARCGFDGSRDYEHYPTVFTAVSARNIQALRAEWERQKQPQPQNSGQNGDTPITAQAQAPVSAAPAQPMPQQSPAAPSRKKSGLIVGICSAVVILVLLANVLTGADTPAADTPAADTNSNVPDITVPEVVVQEPGIANCKAYYVDWYADDEPYALTLAMSEDSDAEPVTAEQLQAMIDEKGCTTLVVQQFDNADGALWRQIGKLTGIQSLCIFYCTTSDLELLSDMRDLQGLYFSCTQADLTEVSALTNLTSLSLDVCYTDDISPLSELKNLQDFSARKSLISDLSPLSGLTQLTSLNIQNFPNDDPNMQITDLSPLANMTQLTTLTLSYNKFTDVTPLANLTQLTTLDLSYNKITDISPLANLTELTSLRLNGNDINDWSPLANLTKLETLEPDVQIDG